MMDFLNKLKEGLVYFDGGTGTMLQSLGLEPGELPELWNLTHPEQITALHRAYLEAGSHIIKTNTFGANRLKFHGRDGIPTVEDVIGAAVQNARRAVSEVGGDCGIAFDVGPTGKLLQPLGDLAFEDAVSIFSEMISCAVACGVDLILIETMNDSYEAKAAVLAAKEHADLPVVVTTVYDQNGKLMTGADPKAMIAMLEGLGVDAVGLNCSLGPRQMLPIVQQMIQYATVPVVVNPNAGLPRQEGGHTVFDVTADQFAADMAEMVRAGARVIGGCCGTTPAYIAEMIRAVKEIPPVPLTEKSHTLISSYTHAVEFGKTPVLIGERINPTGKKKLKDALRTHNMDYILRQAIEQQEHGAHALDVNVGLPELDEPAMMAETITALQAVTDLPLQIDTADPIAMERAMRLYNGKPMVNSVNGKRESMEAVFPLVAKYGGVVVALTLDETGIPETAEGRLDIAARIYRTAATYGISAKDIIIDPLAMTISSDTCSARVTLATLRGIKVRFGGKTSLGVSNVSFGLPDRRAVNAAFFAMAMQEGLDAAIMNPASEEMMRTWYSYCALSGQDPRCAAYISYMDRAEGHAVQPAEPVQMSLRQAVLKGLQGHATELAKQLLQRVSPMTVIREELIPALDDAGRGFEAKTIFLPQLLMTAEAAKAAFEVVRDSMQGEEVQQKRGKIVLATVQGDIHDIGKNIVKVLLENYGFDVLDLGKDVPPAQIVKTVVEQHVPLVGLSALMTTTVPAMEATIAALRRAAPWCSIVVGGAVLTQEYANMIGADQYAADAMETVRYAERCVGSAHQ